MARRQGARDPPPRPPAARSTPRATATAAADATPAAHPKGPSLHATKTMNRAAAATRPDLQGGHHKDAVRLLPPSLAAAREVLEVEGHLMTGTSKAMLHAMIARSSLETSR